MTLPLKDKTPAPADGAAAAAPQPLSPVDFAWLRMDDPTNLMLINGVLVLGERVSRERIAAVLERRLLSIERFRQRVVVPPGGRPYWALAPHVDLAEHLTETELPAPGDEAALTAVVNGLMSTPLDYDKPLWSFHLIHNYHGGTALMGRIHHCIGDGIALLLVLLSLTDVDPAVAATEPGHFEPPLNPFVDLFRHPSRVSSAVHLLAERVMPEGMRLLAASAEAFHSAGRLMTGAAAGEALGRLVLRPPDPKTLFKGPLGVPKRAAWSEPLPLDEVRAVGKALGGTINDVLLAAMTGGLRRYLAGHTEVDPKLNFRAAMPVNLRSLDTMAELGNRFGLVFLSLPVGIADPVERLRELARRARSLKRSAEPVVVYAILKALGLVPLAVQKAVVKIFAAKTTAVMTNVPGPREVLYLAGVPIRDIFFWVPQSGRVGLGISIFSYAGRVRLGVGTDAGLVPDPETIVDGFHEEFAAMRRLAGEAAAT